MTIATRPLIQAPQHPSDSKQQVSQFMQKLQDSICEGLEELDGKAKFKQDQWVRPEGGGGRSRVIVDGDYFEKGGVNFSEVYGSHLPPSIIRQYPELDGETFYATGTSMVLHPRNPYAPTVHLNYRYFEAGNVWWFGGGLDLTPYYGFAEDAQHLHKTLKAACDRHNPHYHRIFKAWCDDYFFLKHRGETRGVGGIFFDYQDGKGKLYKNSNDSPTAKALSDEIGEPSERSWQEIFDFVQDCGNSFLPAYVPIGERRRNMEYGERERNWQLYRRGRYVEFNLVYDRGTIFGLQTNGRTESILMSLPPLVRWDYDYHPEPNTPEADLYETFLKPQNWIDWTPNHA
ncbi:oxygen-dependent coproporphyrinogen oxidase [Tumidithrix helvetica PCC 7403]|uniref:oxygen-dependent coproporphyrinogen oxidase n=1 Tax=Tumidithrix helvetica TaxID=3457545 RepID=UPI003CAD0073